MALRIALVTLTATLLGGALRPNGDDVRDGGTVTPQNTAETKAVVMAAGESPVWGLAGEETTDSSPADVTLDQRNYCCCSSDECATSISPCGPGSVERPCPCPPVSCNPQATPE